MKTQVAVRESLITNKIQYYLNRAKLRGVRVSNKNFNKLVSEVRSAYTTFKGSPTMDGLSFMFRLHYGIKFERSSEYVLEVTRPLEEALEYNPLLPKLGALYYYRS
jgi:hypothetical protein